MSRTIDMTPTWGAVAPIFIAALENGTEAGRASARKEVMNMARVADAYVASTKAPAAAQAVPAGLNEHQTEAIAQADAYTSNAALPTYSDLLALVGRLSRPDAGETLTLDDYRQIAGNLLIGKNADGSSVLMPHGC